MDIGPSFGLWLKKRRRALDLTQDTLAQRVGCSPATIRKIEADERRPSRQIAELLAEVLEIAPADRATFAKVARGERRTDRLPADVPVAAPLPPRSTRLPRPPTSLIGREPELAALARLLSDPQCRLLTIAGPGGIGKTRLALEAATLQGERFADGAYFVPLSALNASEFMVPAIAEALGFAFSGPSEPKQQLLAYLCAAKREMLIVLDNLEHLLDGVELLAEILQQAEGVKLLTTSRERLNLQGEWTLDLHGLPVPPEAPGAEVEGYSSVLLFVRAAQRVSLPFALSAENRAEVARICQLVDGMPLGIELAAAWTHVLSCHEIAEEVARGLDFLETQQRDVPERHRSLRAVFDHSWKMLTEAERRALSRLAIFRGGFSREAAEQVAGASLAILASLVSKSLVQLTEAGRYDLHELIRQYATAQLDTDPMAGAAARQEHYAFYLALAEAAGPHLKSAAQLEWLKRLEEEHDNLRAALEWSLGGDRETLDGQSDLALRLAGALAWFWYMRSHFSQGRGWLLKALEHDKPGTTALRARALEGAGLLNRRLGYHREAYSMAAEGAAISRELGDKHGLAGALTVMGIALESLGDMRECRACYEEALALCREMADPWSLARGLGNLGAHELSFGNQAAGRALLEECVAILEESGDRFLISRELSQLGELAYALGDYAAARAYMERSVAASREIGDPEGVSTALSGLGQVLWVQGDYVSAREVFEEAVTLCQPCCMDTVGLWSLAANYLAQGNLAAAREHIRAASALAEQAENKWQQVRARYFQGMLAYYEGDLGNAALLLEGGIAILRTFQDKIWLAQLLVTLGRTRSARGETARAAVLFGESLDLYCKLGHKHGMATALEGLAGLASSENAERAAWLFGAAEAIRAAIGAPLPPVDRPAHERDVAAIRAHLAETAFAAAWAEGQAMPLAQVVSLASSFLKSSPAQPGLG